jgi:AraC family transcriptional regulator, transcriptional activator of pobA
MVNYKNVKVYDEKDSFSGNIYPEFSIGSYNEPETRGPERLEVHRHTYYEIIWVQSGSGTHVIDFTSYHFKGPCIFLLHPGNIHHIEKDNPTTGGVIKFTNAIFLNDSNDLNFLMSYGVFDDIDVLPVIQLSNTQSEDIGRLFEELHREYNLKQAYSSQIVTAFLKVFLLKIYAIKKSHLKIDLSASSDIIRFRKFQQLLEENFKKNHKPSYYSDMLLITNKTLGNLTRSISGYSPSELIKQRILLEAKRLIYHSDMSVKEISYKLGFDDSAYFTRFFKVNLKISPKEFKKNSA